ncbi:MAG: DUF2812 domain-containing protein [Erysipelotrichaceae bacterium]|nr:DUF2812 domain-containing protein [Erysipelotrichaceae bacterium]
MIKLMNFKIKERAEFETYLNQMAKKGYALKWFNEYVVCFDKTDEALHYYVDYNVDYKLNAHRYIDLEMQKRMNFYKDMGLDFVTIYDYFVVFASKEQFNDFHSDDTIESQIIDKIKDRNKKYRTWLPIAFIVFVFLVYSSSYPFIQPISFDDIYELLAIILCLLMVIVGLFESNYLGLDNKEDILQNINKIKRRTYLKVFKEIVYFTILLAIVGLMYASIEAVLGAILLFSAIFLFRYFYTNGLSEQDDVKKIVIVILSLVGYLIVYTLIRNFMIGL